jgi:hypothetical protein
MFCIVIFQSDIGLYHIPLCLVADHTLCTHGEKQSSLHFAARSDAVAALKALLEVDGTVWRQYT